MSSVSTSSSTSIPDAPMFWGKYLPDGRWLPFTVHCLDVAMVWRALVDVPSFQRVLHKAAGGGLLTHVQLDRLAVLAMLHDVGKANLGFQFKVFDPAAPTGGHIRELAPIFDPNVYDEDLHMAFMRVLSPEIFEWFTDERVAFSYFMATFSHHGRPLRFKGEMSGTYRLAKSWWRPAHGWDPMQAVSELSAAARLAFPGAFVSDETPLPSPPHFHHRFAGLLMLADWIGSHPGWFPIEKVSVAKRLQRNQMTIPKALRAIGLDVSTARAHVAHGPNAFRDRFRFDPRPLQAAIDTLDPAEPDTRLIIAESETGSGKTEAALNWFFKLFQADQVDGLFFALPTRVAARGLYERIRESIARWFPDPRVRPVTLLAVPGYAQVDDVPYTALLPDDTMGNRWDDDSVLSVRDRLWAAQNPKRFLAATVAIGTIDQALLSTVETAHAHLRSVCLDRSLIVVDEVHASDFYMTRLLQALLRHHLSVGGRAMLLSATLGARARHEFLQIATPHLRLPDLPAAEAGPYPAITLSSGTTLPMSATAAQRRKAVAFELLPFAFSPEAVVDRLLTAAREGARIIVVMNTVERANRMLRAIETATGDAANYLFRCRGVVCPHHGRFAPEDRLVLDAAVTEHLGPDTPPGPLVVIGTQTLEQSLDIDGDLLVTDLAPADIMLQRVGRLHRHERRRPPGYERARCIVLTPPESLENALDERGQASPAYKRIGYGSVYEDLRSLELTLQVLGERPEVSIPEDNRRLVEAVTHPTRLDSLTGPRWDRHREWIDGAKLARSVVAREVTADFSAYFGQFEFSEAGGTVAVRLGMDTLQIPLSKPIFSPFGNELHEILVPEHLAPREPDQVLTVEEVRDGVAYLRCGDRQYRYSRYGLEA